MVASRRGASDDRNVRCPWTFLSLYYHLMFSSKERMAWHRSGWSDMSRNILIEWLTNGPVYRCAQSPVNCWHPFEVRRYSHVTNRWYRFAQPPANSWHPFGVRPSAEASRMKPPFPTLLGKSSSTTRLKPVYDNVRTRKSNELQLGICSPSMGEVQSRTQFA